jgi:hypothetical protein
MSCSQRAIDRSAGFGDFRERRRLSVIRRANKPVESSVDD